MSEMSSNLFQKHSNSIRMYMILSTNLKEKNTVILGDLFLFEN
jgi:hypothetical protein